MTDRPARGQPRLASSAGELRLDAVVLLAVVYLVAWRAIAGGRVASALAGQSGATAASSPAMVWLDELPAAQRIAVVAPPGWRLASRGERAAAPAPRVVRAPAQRPLRVRTRSS